MRGLSLAVFACAVLVPGGQGAQKQKPESVACTFAHPQYAGNCVEAATPTETQTPVQACRLILDCLNNAQCVKTYCQSTTIRRGWTLVSPKEKEKGG